MADVKIDQLSDQELDSIMEKIQHMMRLRDHPSTSAGEVANAAAMIQNLLTKYNLSLYEVEQHSTPTKRSADYAKSEPFDLGASSLYRVEWRASLINVIANNNFCRMRYYDRVGKGEGAQNAKAVLLGKPYNVEIVKELYVWIADQLNRIASKDWIAYDKANQSTPKKLRDTKPVFKKSFFIAAVTVINQRLKEERMRAQGENPHALMVLDNQLTAFVEEQYPTYDYHVFKPGSGSPAEKLLCRHVMQSGKNKGEVCMMLEGFAIHVRIRHARAEKRSLAGIQAGAEAGRNVSITPTRKISGQSRTGQGRLS